MLPRMSGGLFQKPQAGTVGDQTGEYFMKSTIGILVAVGVLGFSLAGCSSDQSVQAPDDNPRLPVAQQLTNNDDVFEANPIYSPDGAWILFESDAAGNMDIWRMPAAGGAAEQITTDAAFDSSPYWSPDGLSVVFESERSGSKDIWILDLSVPGAEPVVITDGQGDDGSPAWSPDGTRMVFESNRVKIGGTELWVVPAVGGTPLRVTETPQGVYHRTADWSPDSTQLVFESNREDGQPALYTMSALGGVVHRITALPGYEGHPAWSPDDSLIAFEATTDGSMEVYVVSVTGGEAFRVTSAGGFWPRWSPDGLSIVYAVSGAAEPNIWSVRVE